MVEYKSFIVTIDGDYSYFSIPIEMFLKLKSISDKTKVSIHKLVEDGVHKYGFNINVIKQIIEEYEGLIYEQTSNKKSNR